MRQLNFLILSIGLLGLCPDALQAQQQHPILDQIAEKVVQKDQRSSCQELAAERAHPASGQHEQMEERVVRTLHEDPQMRHEFINRVAAPIANKLFECRLIP